MGNIILGYLEYNYILIILLLAVAGMILQDTALQKFTHVNLMLILLFDFLLSICLYGVDYYSDILCQPGLPLTTCMVGVSIFKVCPLFVALNPFMEHNLGHRIFHGLLAINILVYCSAFFCGIAFHFDENAQLIRGPLGYTSYFIGLGMMVIVLQKSAVYFKYARRKDYIYLWYTMIIILAAVFIDTYTDKHYIQYVTAIGCMFLCSYMYIEKMIFYMTKQNQKYQKQETALMVSQVQPDFVYHILDIIYNLCDTDPALAGNTVITFSDYLRNNLDLSKNPNRVVPADKEMKHVEMFISMEQLRNKNLKVRYDLEDLEFDMPAFIIQPIVEHIVERNDNVFIMSYEDDDNHVILVENEEPYNVRERVTSESGDYENIENISERIEKIAGGTFVVEEGTDGSIKTKITIPIERE